MIDYGRIVDKAQREMARRLAEQPGLVNIPGYSLALRLDEHYYLAPHPGFCKQLARWCLVRQETMQHALVKTGNIVTGTRPKEGARPGSTNSASNASGPALSLSLPLAWEGAVGPQQALLQACFLHSSLIDRAVQVYGSGPVPDIGPVRIPASHKEQVQIFLQGKTEIQALAFAD